MRAYEDHKLSRCNNGKRYPAYVSPSHRIPAARTRHPKYLHCPVAKLESNRFEMTFHLTKHKSGGPYASITLAPTRWLVWPARTMSFLSPFLCFFCPSLISFPAGPAPPRFPWTIRRHREISLCGPPFVSPTTAWMVIVIAR